MGIYDSDYMREGKPPNGWKSGFSIKGWLTVGVIAVSLLASLFYFARHTGATRPIRRVVPAQRATSEKQAAFVERHGKGSLRININTATTEELQTLPGIGPVKAKLIAANRPYQSIDDLGKLQGVRSETRQ